MSDHPVQDPLPNQHFGMRRHEEIGMAEIVGPLVVRQELHHKVRDILARG
jgi:hypothetical protein